MLDVVAQFQAQRPTDRGRLPEDLGDWWFLYKTIRQRRPRMIVEFGSGVSTVVQAQALHDSDSHGHLLSLDASPFWAHSSQACLPPHLATLVQILYTPLVEVEMYGVKGFKHQHMPLVAPNFVYLDGPALTCERQVAMDLLDLEPCFPQDFFLVIDDRKVNTAFLRAHFTRRYKFRRRTYRGANATFELRT